MWEISIKAQLGKVEADPDEVVAAIDASGYRELPVRAMHAVEVARLPLHHNDPFNRIPVAQAFNEPLKLLTADELLAQYGELVVMV